MARDDHIESTGIAQNTGHLGPEENVVIQPCEERRCTFSPYTLTRNETPGMPAKGNLPAV